MKMRESALTVTVFSGWITQITKMEDVCMYYEEHLQRQLMHLEKCLVTEIIVSKKALSRSMFI